MKLMGHKKPDMTNRYIEIADAHQAKNLEKALPVLFPTQAEIEIQEAQDAASGGYLTAKESDDFMEKRLARLDKTTTK